MSSERASALNVDGETIHVFPNTVRWVKSAVRQRGKRSGFLLRTNDRDLWIGPGASVTAGHGSLDSSLPPVLSIDEEADVEEWRKDDGPIGYPLLIELDDTTVDLSHE